MAQSAEPRSYAPNLSGRSNTAAVSDGGIDGEHKPQPGPAARRGVAKLLNRQDTLRDWVEEGRSNYELARSFHVPIADVREVVAMLGLERPPEYAKALIPEPTKNRDCSACGCTFKAPQFRFRCDDCLEYFSKVNGETYSVASA